MLNRLPKAACLMLRVGIDLFDTGHRVAEHLSFDDFFKELGFRDALEKISDGRFHSIDLFLADLGDIESFPIFLLDRKSTRLNSSHLGISYAVFCLKKKNK